MKNVLGTKILSLTLSVALMGPAAHASFRGASADDQLRNSSRSGLNAALKEQGQGATSGSNGLGALPQRGRPQQNGSSANQNTRNSSTQMSDIQSTADSIDLAEEIKNLPVSSEAPATKQNTIQAVAPVAAPNLTTPVNLPSKVPSERSGSERNRQSESRQSPFLAKAHAFAQRSTEQGGMGLKAGSYDLKQVAPGIVHIIPKSGTTVNVGVKTWAKDSQGNVINSKMTPTVGITIRQSGDMVGVYTTKSASNDIRQDSLKSMIVHSDFGEKIAALDAGHQTPKVGSSHVAITVASVDRQTLDATLAYARVGDTTKSPMPSSPGSEPAEVGGGFTGATPATPATNATAATPAAAPATASAQAATPATPNIGAMTSVTRTETTVQKPANNAATIQPAATDIKKVDTAPQASIQRVSAPETSVSAPTQSNIQRATIESKPDVSQSAATPSIPRAQLASANPAIDASVPVETVETPQQQPAQTAVVQAKPAAALNNAHLMGALSQIKNTSSFVNFVPNAASRLVMPKTEAAKVAMAQALGVNFNAIRITGVMPQTVSGKTQYLVTVQGNLNGIQGTLQSGKMTGASLKSLPAPELLQRARLDVIVSQDALHMMGIGPGR